MSGLALFYSLEFELDLLLLSGRLSWPVMAVVVASHCSLVNLYRAVEIASITVYAAKGCDLFMGLSA